MFHVHQLQNRLPAELDYATLNETGFCEKAQVFRQQLEQHPGVELTSLATYIPNLVRTSQSRKWEGPNGAHEVSFYTTNADEHYLDLFGIQLAWQIFYLVVSKFMRLILIAFVIASPGAYYAMNQWLTGFVFHTTLGVLPFTIAILTMVLIGLLTVWLPDVEGCFCQPDGGTADGVNR